MFVTSPVFNFDHCFKRRVLSFPTLGCHTPSVLSMAEFSRHLTHKISKCQMTNSVPVGHCPQEICILFLNVFIACSLFYQALSHNLLRQGTNIFHYCTCPAGRVTFNFHSSCKHNALVFVCLFDLILNVHSTIFQLCGTGLPGLNQY